MIVCAAIVAQIQHESSIKDFRKLVGQTKQVCGRVVTYSIVGDDSSGNCSFQLDIGTPYWRPTFYVSVPGEVAEDRPVARPERYLSQDVCVTGLVQSDKKRTPHIAVSSSAQITIKDEQPNPPFGEGARRLCESGIIRPKLLREVKPNYTRDLMARKAEDKVLLQAVVGTDGSITDVRTVYAMYADMSAEAMKAIRQWKMSPATSRGAPVPVIVEIEEKFTLR